MSCDKYLEPAFPTPIPICYLLGGLAEVYRHRTGMIYRKPLQWLRLFGRLQPSFQRLVKEVFVFVPGYFLSESITIAQFRVTVRGVICRRDGGDENFDWARVSQWVKSVR
jgi:hypothetical protein